MNSPDESSATAWQPFTFGGVAAFAKATASRTLWLGLLFALGWAVIAVWFIAVAYVPAIDEAIANLPETSAIHAGHLEWHGRSPAILSQKPFLVLVVDLNGTGDYGQLGDIQCIFGGTKLRMESLLGYHDMAYDREWSWPFNQTDLEPWWGAWRPFILAGVGSSIALALLFSWCVLATLYTLPACLMAYLWRRPINFSEGWQLSFAALMPGTLCMAFALGAYGLQRLSLVGLLLAYGLHFVLGWIYALLSPLYLPKRASAAVLPAGNPFAEPKTNGQSSPAQAENPFRTDHNPHP